MYYSVVIVTVKMTILCRESRLYSIAIFLLPPFDRDKNICKNKRVPLTENNKTIYNNNMCGENKEREDLQ